MKPEEKIVTMSGISKRLFVALSNFRADPPQLEDALFQLASVIDSTSKYHYPDERSSKKRFVLYLNAISRNIFNIATTGNMILVDCTFMARDGSQKSFGDIVYGIRCSSYHDPNEVDDLIHWGENRSFGTKEGKFIVNGALLMALFLVLISDEANKHHIDVDLFDDDHYLIVKDRHIPFNIFVGNRDEIFTALGLPK